ncbi:hypothetical protein Tco_1213242 [Tanacetum coccineum]
MRSLFLDSPSDSSSKTPSNSHSDTSSDFSLRHSSSGYDISNSLCDSPTIVPLGPSHKRCRYPTSSVLLASPVRKALSLVHADLLPPPKRIRDSDLVTDFEVSSEDGYEPYVPRETSLGVDIEDSYKPYTEPNIDLGVQADIDECFAYADAIRARGTDVRVVVETAAQKEVESSTRGTIKVEVDSRVRPVIDDDMRESVREDVPD